MISTIDALDQYVVVEQLNHSQWHAITPLGGYPSVVHNWAGAVADALWMAATTPLGVMSIDLNYDKLVLLAPGGAA